MEKTIDEEFQSFWVPIIFDEETGRLNLEQLKKELFDYSMLIQNVPKVYMEVTGGKISKPNTDPDEVIGEFNNLINNTVDSAIEELEKLQESPPEPVVQADADGCPMCKDTPTGWQLDNYKYCPVCGTPLN